MSNYSINDGMPTGSPRSHFISGPSGVHSIETPEPTGTISTAPTEDNFVRQAKNSATQTIQQFGDVFRKNKKGVIKNSDGERRVAPGFTEDVEASAKKGKLVAAEKMGTWNRILRNGRKIGIVGLVTAGGVSAVELFKHIKKKHQDSEVAL